MADLDNQTEEALGWAAEGKKLAVDIPEVSFKDAGTFVASMTPIIGDAMAAKDVYDELQKDEPNYYLAGALGGAALVGLVPGLGDAAAKAIKKGAKEVFDVAKRVEVDPNAMGSGLGNLRLKPKQDDVAEAAAILDSDEALSAWQQANKIPENKRQANTEAAKAAAEDLYQGSITSKEARNIIKEDLPVTSIYTEETMPSMPTVAQVAGSLGKKVQKTGVVGVKGFDIPAGTRVGSRLDIPAYNNYDTWVVSIHDGKNDTKGSVLGYGQAVRLKNIKFGSESQDALDIARGKARLRGAKAGTDTPEKPMGKATIARVYGDYVPEDPYVLQEQARKLLSDSEWTQVGMNPYRQSNFYDKNTGLPVFEADEVIQVGPLVLAKGVKKPTKTQLKELAVRTKDGKLRLFNEGGAVMDEQMEMAFGDEGERVDPVSGNEVPTGSLPEEVRDDIPAQLSEGEYVVPADVVRFFGVKFFEDIRNEAKRGFADMEANGRIGGEPIGETGMEMGGDELPFDVSELQMVDDSSEEQPMMNQGGFISGYAEGGESALPYHVATGSDSSGFEIRTFIGADGTKYYIQFMNGKPLTPIPDGATQEATAAEQVSTQVETAAATGTATSNNSNDNDSTPPPPPAEAFDWSDPTVATPEKFLSTYEDIKGMGTGLSYGAGLMLGPLAGLGVKGLMKLQENSMLKGLDSQIESLTNTGNTSQVKKLEEIRNIMQGKNADGSDKLREAPTGIELLTSGETYRGNSITESLANILTKGDGKSYRNGVLVDDATGAVLEPGFANSKSNDPVSTPTSQPSQNNGGGNNDNDTHTSAMRAAKAAAEAKTAAAKETTSGITTGTSTSTASDDTTAGGASLDTAYGISGLNKGGLMKKK